MNPETDQTPETDADFKTVLANLSAEIARMREVIEAWREAHIEATGTDQ